MANRSPLKEQPRGRGGARRVSRACGARGRLRSRALWGTFLPLPQERDAVRQPRWQLSPEWSALPRFSEIPPVPQLMTSLSRHLVHEGKRNPAPLPSEEWFDGRTVCLQEAEGWCRAGALGARTEMSPQKSSCLRDISSEMTAARIPLAGLPCQPATSKGYKGARCWTVRRSLGTLMDFKGETERGSQWLHYLCTRHGRQGEQMFNEENAVHFTIRTFVEWEEGTLPVKQMSMALVA